jgi:ribosomal protein S18 acetylase RimI-like enzyme
MSTSFERATPADAEDLVKMQIVAFHDDARLYPGEEESGPPGYDSVDVMLERISEAIVYKIVMDGRIIGGIIIYDHGQGEMHLDVINIAPEYHNQGIGTQAMQFIEQAHPAEKWTLHTPGYAIRNQHFYEKTGYVKTEEVYDGDFLLYAYEKQMDSPIKKS